MPDTKIDIAELPVTLPGHWNTEGGHEMATRYARMTRAELGNADHSDFSLANALYMAGRNDLDLIVWQTAAKERMRWLSVQLALKSAAREASQSRVAELTAELAACCECDEMHVRLMNEAKTRVNELTAEVERWKAAAEANTEEATDWEARWLTDHETLDASQDLVARLRNSLSWAVNQLDPGLVDAALFKIALSLALQEGE